MKESNTQIELDIPRGLHTGRPPIHLDRFDSASGATTGPLQAVGGGNQNAQDFARFGRGFDSHRPLQKTACTVRRDPLHNVPKT